MVVSGQGKLGIYCMAKNFRENFFRDSTIAKPHPYWVYANHIQITRESAVMASEFSV